MDYSSPMYDLLEKANINEECLNEARDVFKAIYSKKTFNIPTRQDEPDIKEIGNDFYANAEVMKNILNNFGDLIYDFNLDSGPNRNSDYTEIIKLINDKSCMSLKKLSLRNLRGNELSELKENTCMNVTSLKFSTSPYDDGFIDNRKLCQLFPHVEKLTFTTEKSLD